MKAHFAFDNAHDDCTPVVDDETPAIDPPRMTIDIVDEYDEEIDVGTALLAPWVYAAMHQDIKTNTTLAQAANVNDTATLLQDDLQKLLGLIGTLRERLRHNELVMRVKTIRDAENEILGKAIELCKSICAAFSTGRLALLTTAKELAGNFKMEKLLDEVAFENDTLRELYQLVQTAAAQSVYDAWKTYHALPTLDTVMARIPMELQATAKEACERLSEKEQEIMEPIKRAVAIMTAVHTLLKPVVAPNTRESLCTDCLSTLKDRDLFLPEPLQSLLERIGTQA
jgi:DNA-binding XRE family transcriptional regulator